MVKPDTNLLYSKASSQLDHLVGSWSIVHAIYTRFNIPIKILNPDPYLFKLPPYSKQ